MRDVNIGEYAVYINNKKITIYGPANNILWIISLHRRKLKTNRPIKLESYNPTHYNLFSKLYFSSFDAVRMKLSFQGLDLPMEIFDTMNANLMMREMIK